MAAALDALVFEQLEDVAAAWQFQMHEVQTPAGRADERLDELFAGQALEDDLQAEQIA